MAFIAVALICFAFGDFELLALDPWGELAKILRGAGAPDFLATEDLGWAVARTLGLAVLGVAGGAAIGAGLLTVYRFRAVRALCAFLRNIHELFWALMLMQIFGLTAWTGILALIIPYACIFAKIYAELLEEADPRPARSIPGPVGRTSRFFYGTLPDTAGHLRVYTLYRLECALRSSAVMGFVGLPTLGFHLDTAFRQGAYGQAWASCSSSTQ